MKTFKGLLGIAALFAMTGVAQAQFSSTVTAATEYDFRGISLSANDYVLHAFGPDSWEAWDELVRLDASLGRFFRALDARVGPGGWAAMLSADHGSTPLPETADVPAARPWCALVDDRGSARQAGLRPDTPGIADRWQRPCGRGFA